MNPICKYYSLHGNDNNKRGLIQSLMAGYDSLEKCHDVIQWIFPTDIESMHNKNAPILTNEDIHFLRNNTIAQSMIVLSYTIFMGFLGFDYNGEELKINQKTIADREDVWLTPHNHNHLRISRILRSLRLFDRGELAEPLYQLLYKNYKDNPNISDETWEYWDEEINYSLESNKEENTVV